MTLTDWPSAIHLVDEGDSGNSITLHLTINGDRLRLHAGDGHTKQEPLRRERAGTLDLDRESTWPGCR